MHIYIGNLNMMTTATQLAELFLPFGKVLSSKIVTTGARGLSTGAGFVVMDSIRGRQAIRKLHRLLFMNSYIEVKEALDV